MTPAVGFPTTYFPTLTGYQIQYNGLYQTLFAVPEQSFTIGILATKNVTGSPSISSTF
jgi:hypothetical protein